MPSGDVHKPPGPDGQSPNRAKKTVSAAGPPRTAKPAFLAADRQRGKSSEAEENEDEKDQQRWARRTALGVLICDPSDPKLL